MIMVDGIFVGFCDSQVHGNERGVSHKHGSTTHSKNCSRIFQNKSYRFLIDFFLNLKVRGLF